MTFINNNNNNNNNVLFTKVISTATIDYHSARVTFTAAADPRRRAPNIFCGGGGCAIGSGQVTISASFASNVLHP